MVRDSTAYLVLHYLILIVIIFLVVGIIDVYVEAVPLWVGVLIALGLGLLYPRMIVGLGYAPERWEGVEKN